MKAPNRLAWVGYFRKMKKGERKGRTGRFARQRAGKYPSYIPKYARYVFRSSSLVGRSNSNTSIKIYDKMIYMVAIQDAFSRFVVHACLREAPTSNFSNILTWYPFEECVKECFDSFGNPFEIVVDNFFISKTHHPKAKKLLEDTCVLVTPDDHPAQISPLERFFLSVHYEMRDELTSDNLAKYVDFYNFGRPHQALHGYTPACAWLAGSKERFETLVKNTRNNENGRLFQEVRKLVEIN